MRWKVRHWNTDLHMCAPWYMHSHAPSHTYTCTKQTLKTLNDKAWLERTKPTWPLALPMLICERACVHSAQMLTHVPWNLVCSRFSFMGKGIFVLDQGLCFASTYKLTDEPWTHSETLGRSEQMLYQAPTTCPNWAQIGPSSPVSFSYKEPMTWISSLLSAHLQGINSSRADLTWTILRPSPERAWQGPEWELGCRSSLLLKRRRRSWIFGLSFILRPLCSVLDSGLPSARLGWVNSGCLVLALGDKGFLSVCLPGNGWPKPPQLPSLWPFWSPGQGGGFISCRLTNLRF